MKLIKLLTVAARDLVSCLTIVLTVSSFAVWFLSGFDAAVPVMAYAFLSIVMLTLIVTIDSSIVSKTVQKQH